MRMGDDEKASACLSADQFCFQALTLKHCWGVIAVAVFSRALNNEPGLVCVP